MKRIWYYFIRTYIKLGLFFLTKKMKIIGKENIPKNNPVIFIGNHQNALIDALLIPTTAKREIYFLTRASAFKYKWVNFILKSLNMIPVYRVRDGIKTLRKNEEVFDYCKEILNQQKAIQIFPEGMHHLQRKVLPFQKGFARIIEGTLLKYPDLNIDIVPVGFNYDSHLKFPVSVSIVIGKPINATNYFDFTNNKLNYKALLEDASSALKKLTLHIENVDSYEAVINKLEANQVDYLHPISANKMVKNMESLPLKKESKKEKFNIFFPFHLLAKINSLLPLLIWEFVKPKIKDIIFINTYRFALIATIFPLFYLLQTSIILKIFDAKWAVIYLTVTLLLGIISSKTIRFSE